MHGPVARAAVSSSTDAGLSAMLEVIVRLKIQHKPCQLVDVQSAATGLADDLAGSFTSKNNGWS